MRLVKYEILGADELSNLEHEVNAAIEDGWIPIGGVSCSTTSLTMSILYTYLQAMGQYED